MSIDIRFPIVQDAFRLDVDLALPGRGVTSLFGPSGCGKTSLLRAIAGLDFHRDGRLSFMGETWQDERTFVPPHLRPLGYVFQEPSLFEHLDVRGNIAFGTRRIPAEKRRVSMDQAIELLDVGRLLDRKPASLSGGERQRVAIARALAVSPELLLMDEPLAAVDVSRKQEILPWIESLHRELDIPVIHVSHLPEEVARFADHVVLIDHERVLASGGAQAMFSRLNPPLTPESDAAAIIDATVTGYEEGYGLALLEFNGGTLSVAMKPAQTGKPIRLRVAARDVSLTLEHQTGTSILNILPATVTDIREENGAKVLVRLEAGGTPLLASVTRKSAHDLELEPGKFVFAQVKSVALLG